MRLENRESIPIFPTVLTSYAIAGAEALNRELCALILERSRGVPTTPRGERQGGWQSDNHFFESSDATRALRDLVARAIAGLDESNAGLPGMYLLGWANLLGPGEYFSPHTHPGAWSGVYYPDAGDSSAENGGVLQFRDPRAGAHAVESPTNRFDSACTFELHPVTGGLVVFPAYLLHWVTLYRGSRPRFSVSFNVE